jgi:hypothetical protein
MIGLSASILLALTIAACIPGAGMATKVQPPVGLSFSLPAGTSGMLHDTELDLTVHASLDLPQVKVELRLPPEIQLTSGLQSWTGALRGGKERRFALRVRVVQPGEFTLGASAKIMDGTYKGRVAGAVLYIHATPSVVRWDRNPEMH